MEGKLLARAAEFIREARRKKRWTKAVTALAAVVVFGTTYALILPAITLQTECGQEAHTHMEACYTVETITPQPTMLCSAESLELHEHDEDCYNDEDELICGLADFVVHEHDETCCDLDGKLICTLPEIEEHQHDKDCYDTERTLICGQKADEGHAHGAACYEKVRGDLVCTDQEEGHEHEATCYEWTEKLTCEQEVREGHRHTADCYETERVLTCDEPEVELHEHDEDCYEENDDGEPVLTCHKTVVLAHQHEESCIQPPEGEPYEKKVLSCGEKEHAHDESCYLTAPPAEEPPEEELPADGEPAPEEPEEETPVDPPVVTDPSEPRTMTFPYEHDGVMIDFTVSGVLTLPEAGPEDGPQTASAEEISPAEVPEGEPEGEAPQEEPIPADPWEKVELSVVELDETTDAFDRFLNFALENSGNDTLYDLCAMEVHFLYEGVELDTSAWEITAEVKLTRERMTPPEDLSYMTGETDQDSPDQPEAGEIAPEAEVGVVVSLFQASEDEVTQLDSVLLQEGEETPALRVKVEKGLLALTTSTTANPKFTVQYYAYLDVAATNGSNPLDIIDTSGKNLPGNYGTAQSSGNAPSPAKVKNIYLTEAATGSGRYKVKTDRTLCEVYRTRDCEYIKQPNLAYFNSLYENGHYELQAIWVQQPGDTDWTHYEPDIHFTNREKSVEDDTILITDDTVIRLVFDTTQGDYTNDVAFYDYDITDDGKHTAAQGINSASNYSGSGAKLAFGNMNTDTGLSEERWGSNYLNRFNSNLVDGKTSVDQAYGFNGCTFGLVTGLSGETLQYASGVDAPNLFNDGSAKGKTSYDEGQYSLNFERNGDTYTLSSVGGTGTASNLQTFTSRWNWNNTLKIWSNHFWPMDNVTNTDPHTGKTGALGSYIGVSGETKNYPESDNGIAHNNMFGMHYKVQFTLTADYSGPLEYLFFGDDDMWVFLDGRLVCDIGGVHSSVGEYVNLWDYIEKGSSGTHTLTFFYTERGLSGSSCYMQFTLPSVSSITPEQNTDTLTVKKTVEGPDSGEEFQFTIKLMDKDGNPLPDDYSYTRYDANGSIIKQDVIMFDGGSFALKNGEYIVINYLPLGTQYTITETKADGYSTTVKVNGSVTPGETASGSIAKDRKDVVEYVNKTSYALPSTGGPGTSWFLLGGSGLMALALWRYQKKREV